MLSEGSFELGLLSVSGEVVRASVRGVWRYWIENDKTEARLEFTWPGGEACGVGWNYQVALCRAREQMAQGRLTPQCFGACRNLVQTGMCVDDGEGVIGYLARIGEPLDASDLVNIFDSGAKMDLASVAEQMAFKGEWLESLKRHRRNNRLKLAARGRSEADTLRRSRAATYAGR